jgi:peptidoglycan/LPS O-acetylase OafA/YrhL
MTSAVSSGARTNRLVELDALRGMAAIAVVLFHYTTRFDQVFGHSSPPWQSFPVGHYGVNLFFIISGFVIFMTIERVRTPLDFVVTRFSRLYPAYWAAVALTFTITHVLELPGFTVGSWTAAANALMFHGMFGVRHVDGVYWTLQVELTFYFWMLMLLLSGKLEKVHYALYTLIGLRLVYFATEHLAGISLPWKIYALLILDQIPWFAIGITLYRLSFHADRPSARFDRTTLLIAVAALAVVESPTVALLALALAALVYGAVRGHLPVLSRPVLVWLGTISYPLYLLHENIGWSIMRQLQSAGWNVNLMIAVATATSLFLASMVTYLVERPAMLNIRAWYKRSKKSGAG